MKEELIELLPKLRRFSLSLTGSIADADDLLQATVERLLKKGVPANVHLGKWAFRVCRNIWIDETRYRKIRQAPDSENDNLIALSEDGERSAIEKITLSQVHQAMQSLPENQREALALVALQGFSYSETAETLGVPVGTVMSRISRARKALEAQFDVNLLIKS